MNNCISPGYTDPAPPGPAAARQPCCAAGPRTLLRASDSVQAGTACRRRRDRKRRGAAEENPGARARPATPTCDARAKALRRLSLCVLGATLRQAPRAALRRRGHRKLRDREGVLVGSGCGDRREQWEARPHRGRGCPDQTPQAPRPSAPHNPLNTPSSRRRWRRWRRSGSRLRPRAGTASSISARPPWRGGGAGRSRTGCCRS